MKKIYRLIALLLAFVLLSGCALVKDLLFKKEVTWRNQRKPDISQVENWVTYYGPYRDQQVISQLNEFDLVVLGYMDAAQTVPAQPLVMQYIPVMEASPAAQQYYSWTKQIKSEWVLMNNPDYPGTWILDIRQQAVRDLIVQQAIPWHMDHGGQGLMLDTFGDIDLYFYNDTSFVNAGVKMIEQIHQTYPQLPIIINEPGELIYKTYQSVDGIILEQFMADIRTGEMYDQPRGNWGFDDFQQLINFNGSLSVDDKFVIFTNDMVADDNYYNSYLVMKMARDHGLVPSLAAESSLGERYQEIPQRLMMLIE